MTTMQKLIARRWAPALCLVALLCSPLNARFSAGAQQDTQTRRLWDSEYFKAKKTAPAKRHYRVATPQIPTDRVDGNTVLGITLWRLRPSKATDEKETRLFKHSKDKTNVTEWTPERISVDTP